MTENPELSVVVPIFNEEDVLPALREQLETILDRMGLPAEIVLVDDGSSDRSPEFLATWKRLSPRVRVVTLSRNFGHAAACTAGLDFARGRAVVLMDGDMQDPPVVIAELVALWRSGFEVVFARRRKREEPFVRRTLINLFHRVFGLLADASMPENTGIFSLLDRRALEPLKRMRERTRFLPGMRQFVGFRTTEVEYDRPDRPAGEPKQTYRRLLRYGLDAIFSFSRKPLQFSTLLGVAVATGCVVYGMVLLVLRIMGINVVQGFTTVAAGMFFLGGVQLISLGILGEYVSRIFDEVKQRPIYIVREEESHSSNTIDSGSSDDSKTQA